jgi:FKBP-type peptidyl-prolyl cis-trans isomerase FkpA
MELIMRKLTLPLVFVSAFALQACNQQPPATEEAAPAAATPAVALETQEQRISYAIAYSVGQRMTSNEFPLDTAAFVQGVTDALNQADPAISQEAMQAEMQAFQEKMMAEQQAADAAMLAANEAAGTAFLQENAAREGVTVTESGLQYEVLTAADGATPGAEDTVEVHYRGTLVDGTEFDSSYSRGQTVSFGVGQVIAGWTEALQLMNVGSKYKLAIPAELAYGTAGAPPVIGPNAVLVFEVELVSIVGQEAEAAAE